MSNRSWSLSYYSVCVIMQCILNGFFIILTCQSQFSMRSLEMSTNSIFVWKISKMSQIDKLACPHSFLLDFSWCFRFLSTTLLWIVLQLSIEEFAYHLHCYLCRYNEFNGVWWLMVFYSEENDEQFIIVSKSCFSCKHLTDFA